MSDPTNAGEVRVPRVVTGVPGLDEVLCGGLLRGGVNLVVGPPGSGKTVLAAQVAFHHAVSGGRVIYLTVLTEPHGRMVEILRSMAFFDESAVGDAVYFVSGYRELEKDGPSGLLQVIQSTVRERHASLLVVDGGELVAATRSPLEVQKFTHDLNVFLSAVECTGILLSTGDPVLPEVAMVEAIIVLDLRNVASRSLRELRVTKLRGSETLEGTHHYWIRSTGVSVFPRTEALAAHAAMQQEHLDKKRRVLRFGVRELDSAMGGGIPSGTTTMILGAAGSGKTLLGCTFLSAGAEDGEHGLYFGFFEPPDRLVEKADGIGLSFRGHVEAGTITCVWQPPLERLLDSLAQRLLENVKRTNATRVVVDGVDGFRHVAPDPERLSGFLIALLHQLRRLGATVLLTLETDLFGMGSIVPLQGLSAMTDNIVLLRYVELGAQLRRLLSVVKVRDHGHDSSLHALEITSSGLIVSAPSPREKVTPGTIYRESARPISERKPARKRVPGKDRR